jgi:hypothetical protein
MKMIEIKAGTRIQAAPDSENPDFILEVIEIGLKNDQGWPAARIKYPDGSEEIAAIENLDYGINRRGMIIIN